MTGTDENILQEDTRAIINSLAHTKDVRIIVFGDYALDKYLYSDPENDEISAETGKNVFCIHKKKIMAGVGGTITNNLCALGAQVRCIGLIGDDGEGKELTDALTRAGADTSYFVRTNRMCTCTYQKVLRLQKDGTYTEYSRTDFRNFEEPSVELQDQMLEALKDSLEWADGVIITDQFYQRNMSAVTDYIRSHLNELAGTRKDKIFYVDSRAFANEYHHMIVKCNNIELFSLLNHADTSRGIKSADQVSASEEKELTEIITAGRKIQQSQDIELIVTCGSRGMVVFNPEPVIIPAFHVEGPIDIVGAGDASNAALVLGMVLGLSRRQAARLACCVSSITIQQLNTTGTASREKVIERLKNAAAPTKESRL